MYTYMQSIFTKVLRLINKRRRKDLNKLIIPCHGFFCSFKYSVDFITNTIKYYVHDQMITSMGYGKLLHNRHIPSSGALDRNPNNIISCGKKNKRLTCLDYLSMAPPSQLLRVVTNGAAGKGSEPHTSMKPMDFHQKAHLQGSFVKVFLIWKEKNILHLKGETKWSICKKYFDRTIKNRLSTGLAFILIAFW